MNNDKIINHYQTWLEGFNKQLIDHLGKVKMKQVQLYEITGLGRAAWYRRMENPRLWKGEEVEEICSLLEIPLGLYDQYKGLIFQLENEVKAAGLKKLKVAEKLGLNYEQLYRRFNDPWLFTFEETRKICQITSAMK